MNDVKSVVFWPAGREVGEGLMSFDVGCDLKVNSKQARDSQHYFLGALSLGSF